MQNFHIIYVGEGQFEVECLDRVFIVNMNKRECSCGQFQLSVLPCVHAQVARKHKLVIEDYVHEFCTE